MPSTCSHSSLAGQLPFLPSFKKSTRANKFPLCHATLLHSFFFLNNSCSCHFRGSISATFPPADGGCDQEEWVASSPISLHSSLSRLALICMLPTQLCLLSSQIHSCQKLLFSPTQVPGCATGMCPGLCFDVIYMKSTVLAENEPSGTSIFFSFSTINEGKTSCF